MAQPLLEIRNLSTGFITEGGIVKAVDGVSLTIQPGQTLCVVGESGSGKSVTSLSVMRLTEYDGGLVLDGEIHFQGENLLTKTQDQMRRIRGKKIAMIFQEPMNALNPVFTVGDQIAEVVRLHERVSKDEAWARAVEMLRQVGIPEPELRARQYPHELSGGMCQRVVIAMALVCRPELVIADEPTTALDVTVQAQILDLLRQLQQEFGTAVMLITHDMGVAAEMADRIAVMYAGIIVEEGTVEQIFERPHHPYTIGLLQSIPGFEGERGTELYTIRGSIPNLARLPKGCRFHPRCPFATKRCQSEAPPLQELAEGRKVACWYAEQVASGQPVGVAAGSVAEPAAQAGASADNRDASAGEGNRS
ncbi:MAG: ABC transporter ATP-binding protein [Alicyclobacillus herbarius]|uniref:ABC transporter ATP-binding protein n=1 Tax=Alicyclobacillus herbarius TaxID=122960 RepID=UPI0003F63466|nr:ABC transporter ATP-binding protein [Alicyclobacillus herbarius]MCL6631881.1 ABC transporter ATP-binding protein [Alicyclobacillus herbarius]